MTTIGAHSRPSLARGVRLQNDRVSGEPVLLSPEGIVVLNDTAHEILTRCDGKTSVGEIAAALAAEYDAPPDALREDVVSCLRELREKNLIAL